MTKILSFEDKIGPREQGGLDLGKVVGRGWGGQAPGRHIAKRLSSNPDTTLNLIVRPR